MDTTGKIYMAIAAVAIIAAVIAFWFISKRAPKGTLLAIGVALWVFGSIMSSQPIREMKLIAGILQLSGFIGGILGLFELIKKPKGAKKNRTPKSSQMPTIVVAVGIGLCVPGCSKQDPDQLAAATVANRQLSDVQAIEEIAKQVFKNPDARNSPVATFRCRLPFIPAGTQRSRHCGADRAQPW